MYITENDLSYDAAKLDFEAMLRTAEVAVQYLCQEIAKYLGEVNTARRNNDLTSLHLSAQWLKQDAVELAICAEMLSTLRGATTRSQIEIVNKPPMKEKEE